MERRRERSCLVTDQHVSVSFTSRSNIVFAVVTPVSQKVLRWVLSFLQVSDLTLVLHIISVSNAEP